MKKFLSVVLSLSLAVSPIQANVCSATDVVAVQRNVTELINKLPGKLRVPIHKLLNGDPTWNATKLSLNETETRMLNEVLVEMHLLKHRESLDGDVEHVARKRTIEIRWLDVFFVLGLCAVVCWDSYQHKKILNQARYIMSGTEAHRTLLKIGTIAADKLPNFKTVKKGNQ